MEKIDLRDEENETFHRVAGWFKRATDDENPLSALSLFDLFWFVLLRFLQFVLPPVFGLIGLCIGLMFGTLDAVIITATAGFLLGWALARTIRAMIFY